MPAPTVELNIQNTPMGRRIYTDQVEDSINNAVSELYTLISQIPAGPQGERGPAGIQGERWIVGATREYAEGLTCVTGNAVYRRFPGLNMVGLFRCLQPTVINNLNFPASLVSNSSWELVLAIPGGERGEQGLRGEQGEQGLQGLPGVDGVDGISPEILTFATRAEAISASQANPDALVISTEGMI